MSVWPSVDAGERGPDAVPSPPVRIGFVLHVMQVAGAEVLVAEIIRRLGTRIEPVVLCLDGVGQLGERMRRQGVPVVALDRRSGLDWRLPGRLAREIKARHLEVIHAHQYTPFFYAAMARLLLRRRIHLMFTEHGRHFPDVVSGKRRLMNRAALVRLADEINAVCQFSAASLARVDGFLGKPIGVIPNGIDMPRYAAALPADIKRHVGLPTDRRYVACIARFHPVKDHDTLLRAFSRLAVDWPDVDLLLAGDGPLRPTLVSLCESLGIARRVRFLGVRDDVPELLQAAEVFTLTSVSEAASLTLLEAMASSVPVVVTAVGGNPELVTHGVHGLLVERGNVEGLAAALARLLADPVAAGAMGRAGRARVSEHYRLEQTIDTYYHRYKAAADRLRGGADGSSTLSSP
jgi:L-malate glycosyltransferase